MRNALRSLILSSFFAFFITAFPQDGQIIFKNIGIQKADGSGAVYNVPLYQSACLAGNSTTGAGLVPGGMTVGLFNAADPNTPLATALLGTTANSAPYIATPIQQTVTVTGHPPGSMAPLVIAAWSTSAGSFAAAKITSGAFWAQWSFTSQPLGGTPPGGGLPILPPTLTGWGPEDGSGLIAAFSDCPEPSAIGFGIFGLAILMIASRRSRSAAHSVC